MSDRNQLRAIAPELSPAATPRGGGSRRIRHASIAFDIEPGSSGPARYVDGVVRGLDPDEWDVHFIQLKESSKNSLAPSTSESQTAASDPSPRRLGQRLGRLAPKTARYFAGVGRYSLRQAKLMRQLPIDIFHTQYTGCEESPLAGRLARVPNILGTFHVDSTYDLENLRGRFADRTLERISNRCLHRAIAVSEATKLDWVRRTGIDPVRVVTIHNGVDPERFQRRQTRAAARHALGLPDGDRLIIGGVGRLDAAKGFGYLIEAMVHLQDVPNLTLAIAGQGPLRAELESQVARLGLADRVGLLGFCSDVQTVYEAVDVFCLSSLCEALPYALLEAMSHELPVVGTTVGGVSEVIVPGETGFVVPPRDTGSLAAALRPLLESAGLRTRMGSAGRERVSRHFHEADCVRKTIDVYRSMLKLPNHVEV